MEDINIEHNDDDEHEFIGIGIDNMNTRNTSKTVELSYLFPDNENSESSGGVQCEDDEDIKDYKVSSPEVLMSVLVLSLLFQATMILVSGLEVLISPGLLPRVVWAMLMILGTLINLIWSLVLAVRYINIIYYNIKCFFSYRKNDL